VRGRIRVVRRRRAKSGILYAQGRPVRVWREVRASWESWMLERITDCGRGVAWNERKLE